jgi:hypothetical protein
LSSAPTIIPQHPAGRNRDSALEELRAERALLTQLLKATGGSGELANLHDEIEDRLIEALQDRRRRMREEASRG